MNQISLRAEAESTELQICRVEKEDFFSFLVMVKKIKQNRKRRQLDGTSQKWKEQNKDHNY